MLSGRTAVTVFLAATLAACGSASSKPTSASTPSPTEAGTLVGLVAIGHSGLTGAASDQGRPHADVGENSWVTGTNPVVDSVYSRMLAADPALSEHVYNGGIDGSQASALLGELQDALTHVPHPQLVVLQTIDNDVHCDGTDAANIAPFGQAVADALAYLGQHSPTSQVFAISQFGRPANDIEVVRKDPFRAQQLEGTGPCDVLDDRARVIPTHVATLTHTVELYETELARVCAASAGCHYGDMTRPYITALGDSFDGNHQNAMGAHKWAAQAWPLIAKILGVPAS